MIMQDYIEDLLDTGFDDWDEDFVEDYSEL